MAVVACLMLTACGGGETIGPGGSANPPLPPRTSLAPIAGKWSGVVSELRTPNRYTSVITVGDSARVSEDVGQVDYPTLACGGTLRFEAVNQGAYRFSGLLTYGVGNCTSGGFIILSRNEDGTLAFVGIGANSNPNATATLTRSQ